MSVGDEYDPRTCVTAGELRSVGFALPADVPDCAWMLRVFVPYRVDGPAHATGPDEDPYPAVERLWTESFLARQLRRSSGGDSPVVVTRLGGDLSSWRAGHSGR